MTPEFMLILTNLYFGGYLKNILAGPSVNSQIRGNEHLSSLHLSFLDHQNLFSDSK